MPAAREVRERFRLSNRLGDSAQCSLLPLSFLFLHCPISLCRVVAGTCWQRSSTQLQYPAASCSFCRPACFSSPKPKTRSTLCFRLASLSLGPQLVLGKPRECTLSIVASALALCCRTEYEQVLQKRVEPSVPRRRKVERRFDGNDSAHTRLAVQMHGVVRRCGAWLFSLFKSVEYVGGSPTPKLFNTVL